MGTTRDFFQCLICSSFFSSLSKVEKHVKTHDDSEIPVEKAEMGRRRGMLPIRKTTFVNCYVRVVKNQIDPEFLVKYDKVEAMEETFKRKSTRNRELKLLGVSGHHNDVLKEPDKRTRRGNLQEKAILPVSDQEEDDDIAKMVVKKKKKRKLWKWDGKEYPFKCEYCPHSFPKRILLPHHILREHKDVAKTIKCPVTTCTKACVTFSTLRNHINYPSKAERAELLVEKEFRRLSTFTERDKETLKSYEKLNCQFCLWSGDSSLEKLKKHKEKEHGKEVILQCPCWKKMVVNSVTDLIHHVKFYHASYLDPIEERQKGIVETESRFKCDKCGSKFRYESQLTHHLPSHDKEKKYEEADRIFKCPSCYKAFRHKDILRRHFTLHLENNPWTCDFPNCNRKFTSKSNLNRHKLLHSESYLQAMRVHCPICNQALSRRDRLVKHMERVHKPEEMLNGSPIPSRLPRLQVKKYETYQTKVGETEQTDPANNEQAPLEEATPTSSVIKSERVEEIHLVDKIILDENGTAIHLKGEHLSPQKTTSESSSSKSLATQPSSTSASNKETLQTTPYLTHVISHDPAFKRLDSNESGVLDVVARYYNYTPAKIFTCKECQTNFARAWSLQLHLRTFHNKTLIDDSTAIISHNSDEEAVDGNSSQKITLMCGTCAYVAKDAQDLSKHVKSFHSKYRCNTCGISLKNAQYLERHIKKIHLAPRNHFCNHCKKGFTTEAKARRHENKVHEKPAKNEERKQCPICLKPFSPPYIAAHLRKHEAKTAKQMEKLKCQLCGDSFSCTMALRRHIDCIHLAKPFNKVRNRKLKHKKYPWLATRAAAVPKPKKDEWFRPLLQKMSGVTETDKQDAEAIRAPEPEETEVGAMSILGI